MAAPACMQRLLCRAAGRLPGALGVRSPGALGVRSPGALGVRSLSTARSVAPTRLEPRLENIISRFQASMKAGTQRGEKSKAIVDDFGQLQRIRVQQVLLVCSDYDSYTFEEDGLLSEQLHDWYAEHNLSKPPRIDRVSSTEQALTRFKESMSYDMGYDMVITLMRMEGHSSFVSAIHALNPSVPIACLALNPAELTTLDPRVDESARLNVNKRLMWETAKASPSTQTPAGTSLANAWIWPFLWAGSPSLFTAMFKAVEDRLNIRADSEYGVQAILVVEDSVKFYSSYMPLLYSLLWKQNKALENETMQTRERILRMYSRPKIIMCTNYEEALDLYDRYRENIHGLITDLGFPKGGVHDETAGLAFASHVRETNPELPVLMQSAQPEDSELAATARALGLKFVCKSSPYLLHAVREYMVDDLMFGPLQFEDGTTGKQLGQVSSVTELSQTWPDLPLSSIAHHARHAHLSRWFFARAEFELAKRFRASQYPSDFIDGDGKERPDWLRNWITSEVNKHRNKLAPLVDDAATADPANTPIIRLGSGSLGGKGRGFRFLHSLSDKCDMASVIPGIELHVPRCFILATSIFDNFVDANDLYMPALDATDDAEVRRLFADATLPPDVTADLKAWLKTIDGPLAVRSSSLFEDAFLQPFAGTYESMMLPNKAASPITRLDEVSYAIKMVYASTYSQQARSYAESTSNRTEEEKMAVILQPLAGAQRGGYFYPSLAGVANALDFYPPPNTVSESGCAQIGLGLGCGVVDGAPAVHFSLGDPSSLTGDVGALKVSALDLNAPVDGNLLVRLDEPAAAEAALATFLRSNEPASAPEAASSLPGLTEDVHGERVVFKKSYGDVQRDAAAAGSAAAPPAAGLSQLPLPQLLGGEVPLVKALSFLLRLGTAGLGCPVEIEFALALRGSEEEKHKLHVLQIRPQATLSTKASDRFQFLPTSDYAAVASKRALGHGRFGGITDVVYVSPERFERSSTEQIAAEIAEVNAHTAAEGRKYLLMAPGRWGSKDSANGIPVGWQDIDNSSFIVETTLDQAVPLSQGSHFFQNIISFGLGYMTVHPTDTKAVPLLPTSTGQAAEVADYAYWDGQPALEHGHKFVRHVRVDEPLEIVVDGHSRHGVVMKSGKPFDTYVGQVDAFMTLAQEQYNASG